MKKYYIGLAAICALVAGLTIYTLVIGVIGKQDIDTDKKAQDIATKINNYVTKYGTIPIDLKAVGASDVPKTISYTKKSDESYEFCVTYRAASNGGYGAGISEVLTAPLFGGYSNTSSSLSGDLDVSNSTYQPSSLYLSGAHKKGQNCQTIKPYLYNNSSFYNYNYNPTPPPSSLLQSNSKDTERQTDIKALHGQIEAYYAQNGYYPTLANLNDSSWRATNMKGLDSEALRDPDGSAYTLNTYIQTADHKYAYDVYTTGGGTCDNVKIDCTAYILSAELSTGSTFTKISLN